MLMQTNVSLEEELRKANAAKAQLETYKRQVCERMLHHVTWQELTCVCSGGGAAEQAV